ncbi:MAG: efflux RND transporter periplasmic adaptor subunit [Planctomycetes bacterium]|nr:efflux RND transporter periplasmic adaptor subunit [Planctomycetota bacterium]
MSILDRALALPLLALLASNLVTACRPVPHADPGSVAAPAPPQSALANLGQSHLLHLVVPPLVRGQRASLLLHGTRLADGAPQSGGEVVLRFQGPAGERVEARASERQPGHWPAEVTLPASGRWRVSVDVRAAEGAESVDLGSVEVHVDLAAAVRAAAVEPPAGSFGFPFESQWPIGMCFERVAPHAFTDRVRVNGRIEPRPGARAHATAPVAGRVEPPASGRIPRPGERVAAGEVVARVVTLLQASDVVALQALEYQQHQLRHELDLQQLEAERALGSARVRIQAGTRAVERAERLLTGALGSQVEVDAARAELELAQAEEHAALSSLDSVNRLRNEHAHDPGVEAPSFDVIAPIAGVLASVDIVPGETVEAGALLASILDLSRVWAVAEVPEHRLNALASAVSAQVRPRGLEDVLWAEPPVYASPSVDPLTRCADLAFELANWGGQLRAGMLATIDLHFYTRPGVLTVPAAAVAHEQGRPVVYALVDGETFVKRRLRLGARDGDRYEVLEGLAAGEIVAASGAEDLRLAALAGSGQIVDHHHH